MTTEQSHAIGCFAIDRFSMAPAQESLQNEAPEGANRLPGSRRQRQWRSGQKQESGRFPQHYDLLQLALFDQRADGGQRLLDMQRQDVVPVPEAPQRCDSLPRFLKDDAPTMIDLFSGCGGVTEGFKKAGFRVLAAVEIDPSAARTYRLNHPEVVVYQQDIRSVSPDDVMRRCALASGQLTVLTACAPCQPFSPINRKRSVDENKHLIFEVLRFAQALRPLFLFMENVPGLLNETAIINRLYEELQACGYSMTKPTIVNAADYGVPQIRRRLIVLGTLLDEAIPIPLATHAPPDKAKRLGKERWVTVADAFAGLELVPEGACSVVDPLHKARRHVPLVVERLKHISHNGGSRTMLPPDLQLPCHVRRAHDGYHNVYGRMDFHKPANTLTAGCTDVAKGRFAHPVFNRAITLREAARLQTFPDDYQFYGSVVHISAQIGNAVPVALAHVFACSFRERQERMMRNEGESSSPTATERA